MTPSITRADEPFNPVRHLAKHHRPEVEPVLTLAELAAHLSVSVQTLYDLRYRGRGPRGFRVGRELHFRVSEIEAWLDRLEAEDASAWLDGAGM